MLPWSMRLPNTAQIADYRKLLHQKSILLQVEEWFGGPRYMNLMHFCIQYLRNFASGSLPFQTFFGGLCHCEYALAGYGLYRQGCQDQATPLLGACRLMASGHLIPTERQIVPSTSTCPKGTPPFAERCSTGCLLTNSLTAGV